MERKDDYDDGYGYGDGGDEYGYGEDGGEEYGDYLTTEEAYGGGNEYAYDEYDYDDL